MKKTTKLIDRTKIDWYTQIFEIRKQETDRGFIIFVHSIFDTALNNLLKKYFVNTLTRRDDILNQETGKPSYWYKVAYCYRLGLISLKFKSDLLMLGRIRNKFAHKIDLNSFEDSLVNKDFDKLLKNSSEFVQEMADNRKEYFKDYTDKNTKVILTLAWMIGHLYKLITSTVQLEPAYSEFGYKEEH